MKGRVIDQVISLKLVSNAPAIDTGAGLIFQTQLQEFLQPIPNLANFQVDAIEYTSIGNLVTTVVPPYDVYTGSFNIATVASVYLTLYNGKKEIVLKNYPVIDLLNSVYYDPTFTTNVITDDVNRTRLFNIKGVDPMSSYITVVPLNTTVTYPADLGVLNFYKFKND